MHQADENDGSHEDDGLEVNVAHHELAALPEDDYALIWFVRWATMKDRGDGGVNLESEELYQQELYEAIAAGEAVVMAPLRPHQLPMAYEALAGVVLGGAGLAGHHPETDQELATFESCYSIHCMPADALVSIQVGLGGGSDAIH